MKLKVLGVDPGLQTTGFCVLKKEGTVTTIENMGFLPLPAHKSIPERIFMFYQFFQQKIQQEEITVLALEHPFLGKNAQTFLKLGYLRGILCLLTQQHNMSLHEFAPRQVKQAITGFGGADKEQVARMLMRLFPGIVPQKKLDITDAVAVALCGIWQK